MRVPPHGSSLAGSNQRACEKGAWKHGTTESGAAKGRWGSVAEMQAKVMTGQADRQAGGHRLGLVLC